MLDRGDPAGRHRRRDPGPSGAAGPPGQVPRPGADAASVLAVPAVVIAATTAVMTPAWAGSEGPGRHGRNASASPPPPPDRRGTSSCGRRTACRAAWVTWAPPTARRHADVRQHERPDRRAGAGRREPDQGTDASLVRFENVNNAIAAGDTGWPPTARAPALRRPRPSYQGLNRRTRRRSCTRST